MNPYLTLALSLFLIVFPVTLFYGATKVPHDKHGEPYDPETHIIAALVTALLVIAIAEGILVAYLNLHR